MIWGRVIIVFELCETLYLKDVRHGEGNGGSLLQQVGVVLGHDTQEHLPLLAVQGVQLLLELVRPALGPPILGAGGDVLPGLEEGGAAGLQVRIEVIRPVEGIATEGTLHPRTHIEAGPVHSALVLD